MIALMDIILVDTFDCQSANRQLPLASLQLGHTSRVDPQSISTTLIPDSKTTEEVPEVLSDVNGRPAAFDHVISAALVPSIRQGDKRRILVEISMREFTLNLIIRVAGCYSEKANALFRAIQLSVVYGCHLLSCDSTIAVYCCSSLQSRRLRF